MFNRFGIWPNLTLLQGPEEFMKLGGYTALLTRLNEILEVEWR